MKRKYNPTEAEMQIIRDLYDGSSLALNKIMRITERKYPRYYVRKIAATMGLARVTESDWTAAEEDYVAEHYPRMGLRSLQRGLKHMGFRRSTTAIWVKLKRLRISGNIDDGFTLRSLCDFLWAGQENHKIIQRWIDNGWLHGKRRGTLRTKKQGGDQWYFSPEWVRSFIISHPDEIDLRLVDKESFIRLLSGSYESLCLCKCPICGRDHEQRIFNPGVVKPRINCPECKTRCIDEDDTFDLPEPSRI